MLDFSGPRFPQLWNKVLRLGFLYDLCHCEGKCGHMHTVNINHAVRTLPLYLLSFLLSMNKSFLRIQNWTIVPQPSKYYITEKVRFEIPLNTNKNKINIQDIFVQYHKASLKITIVLRLFCKPDFRHFRKSEYLKLLVSSFLL